MGWSIGPQQREKLYGRSAASPEERHQLADGDAARRARVESVVHQPKDPEDTNGWRVHGDRKQRTDRRR